VSLRQQCATCSKNSAILLENSLAFRRSINRGHSIQDHSVRCQGCPGTVSAMAKQPAQSGEDSGGALQAATLLTDKYGITPVARWLGLGYGKLKLRAQASQTASNPRPTTPPAPRISDSDAATPPTGFVELPPFQQLEAHKPSAGTLIRLQAPDDTRLAIRLSLGESVDLLGLVDRLWCRQA